MSLMQLAGQVQRAGTPTGPAAGTGERGRDLLDAGKK
jgi:hypothetical protein